MLDTHRSHQWGHRHIIYPKYQHSGFFSVAQDWSQILWLDVFLFYFLMDCIILWLSRWTNNLQWIIYPTDFDSFAAYWISMSRPRFQLAYLLFEFIWHVPLSFFFPKTLSSNQRQLLKKFDRLQLKVVVAAMNQGVDSPKCRNFTWETRI